jgi:uncharacterized integral membrane protein
MSESEGERDAFAARGPAEERGPTEERGPAEERGPTRAAEPATDRAAERVDRTPLTQQIGRVVLALLAVAFLAFSLVNRQPVLVDWVVTETLTPLIALLIGAFLLGVAVGAGLFWRRTRRRRRLEQTDSG